MSATAFRAVMDPGRNTCEPVLTHFKSEYAVDRAPFLGRKGSDGADTALPLCGIRRLAERITALPRDCEAKVHPRSASSTAMPAPSPAPF